VKLLAVEAEVRSWCGITAPPGRSVDCEAVGGGERGSLCGITSFPGRLVDCEAFGGGGSGMNKWCKWCDPLRIALLFRDYRHCWCK